jgi:hypothetical protein
MPKTTISKSRQITKNDDEFDKKRKNDDESDEPWFVSWFVSWGFGFSTKPCLEEP